MFTTTAPAPQMDSGSISGSGMPQMLFSTRRKTEKQPHAKTSRGDSSAVIASSSSMLVANTIEPAAQATGHYSLRSSRGATLTSNVHKKSH